MITFEAYQAAASKVPLALRNNRDRIDLPILGLQEESAKVGRLLAQAFASGKLHLPGEQRARVRDALAEILWCMALLCGETGIAMQDVATRGMEQLQARAKDLDPDRR